MMQNGKWFWRVLGKTFCVIRWKLLGVSFLGQILKVHDKVLKTELRLHVDEDDPITRNFSSFLFYDNIFSQMGKMGHLTISISTFTLKHSFMLISYRVGVGPIGFCC